MLTPQVTVVQTDCSKILKCNTKRVTLINAVLDSMPTYVMSMFPIPAGVVYGLD